MNEIWNIGNQSNLTPIRDLANRVQFMTRTKSKIVLVDPKTIHGPLYEEAWDKIPNADKIKRELGWYPKHDINSIVRDVIEFYKK